MSRVTEITSKNVLVMSHYFSQIGNPSQKIGGIVEVFENSIISNFLLQTSQEVQKLLVVD